MADNLGELTKQLVDEGKIIESGFDELKTAAYPNGLPREKEIQLRAYFFAGASWLFASIMALDPDDTPTDSDMRRMDSIHRELENFFTTAEQMEQ